MGVDSETVAQQQLTTTTTKMVVFACCWLMLGPPQPYLTALLPHKQKQNIWTYLTVLHQLSSFFHSLTLSLSFSLFVQVALELSR